MISSPLYSAEWSVRLAPHDSRGVAFDVACPTSLPTTSRKLMLPARFSFFETSENDRLPNPSIRIDDDGPEQNLATGISSLSRLSDGVTSTPRPLTAATSSLTAEIVEINSVSRAETSEPSAVEVLESGILWSWHCGCLGAWSRWSRQHFRAS